MLNEINTVEARSYSLKSYILLEGKYEANRMAPKYKGWKKIRLNIPLKLNLK